MLHISISENPNPNNILYSMLYVFFCSDIQSLEKKEYQKICIHLLCDQPGNVYRISGYLFMYKLFTLTMINLTSQGVILLKKTFIS